ncbi:SRPBCC family protein [Kineococcus gynurae]|uniref:SRPBCC family protein n=1 Tax=Kineococcus gynurae TaxID=452979 RepID=A0ABV5LXG5_9ACTN
MSFPGASERSVQVRGPAAPQRVWEDYAQFANWSRWSPQIRGVATDRPRITAGAVGQVLGPAGLRVDFRILDVDEAARRWTWRVGLGAVGMTMRHSVIGIPGGTLTGLLIGGPGPAIHAYAPVARLALRRLVSAPGSGGGSPRGRPPRPRPR